MPAHSSSMTPARRTLYALLVCATSAPSASACCLTDWLYGRQPAYAIAPAVAVTPGYAAACPTAPYAAGYAPYAASYTPYTAGYTPVMTAVPSSSVLPLAGTSIYAQPSSVQLPAYGTVPLNNPSVYSDLAITSGYRGAVPAGGSPYGTGNIYPNNYASASPSVITTPATIYQANYGSSVQLPVTPTYAAPQQGGLSRFFNSLLGTGYRTSYYTAPITYYRPATTIDPVTGTTVTIQQSCASTVQQVQRTPYATFDPAQSYPQTLPVGSSYEMTPNSAIAPCNATSTLDSSSGTYYGATTIPSTSLSDGYASPASGTAGNDDLQPLAPPTLPPNSAFSGRLSYPNDDTSEIHTNLSPLTGDPLTSNPLTGSSTTVDDAYRQGYEAGRTATQKEAKQEASPAYAPYATPETPSVTPYGNQSDDTSPSKRPPTESQYQLAPPENNRPSTGDSGQRTQLEIEQDARDLKGLTTGSSNTQGSNRLVNESVDSAPRVRPIPAPDNYHNPFDTTEQLKAPNLLPALPPPSASYYRAAPQPSRHAIPQRLSVPVREASIHGTADRMPALAPRDASQRRVAEPQNSPAPRANAWQTNVRQQSQSSGWYTTGQ